MKTSLLFFLLFTSWLVNAQEVTTPDEKVIQAIQGYHRKSDRGLVVGVIYQGKKSFYSYGETSKGNKQAPTAKNLFEIGPVTEIFTTALLADLVRRGEVSLNDSLARFFPAGFRLPGYLSAECKPTRVPLLSDLLSTSLYTCEPEPGTFTLPIRLCDLASHTTGLPTLERLRITHRRNPYAHYSQQDMDDLLQSYQFNGPHQPQYQYSPLNMALLGRAMAFKAKKTYEQLLMEALCQPLNLPDTRITLNSEQVARRLPGHTQQGKTTPYWTFDALAAAGALYSTPEDLLQWLAVQVGLTSDNFFYSQAMTHQSNYPVNQKMKSGLGWWITSANSNGKEMIERYGQTGGFSCYVGFEKTSRTAVVVLSNTARSTEELGQAVLRSLLPFTLAAE